VLWILAAACASFAGEIGCSCSSIRDAAGAAAAVGGAVCGAQQRLHAIAIALTASDGVRLVALCCRTSPLGGLACHDLSARLDLGGGSACRGESPARSAGLPGSVRGLRDDGDRILPLSQTEVWQPVKEEEGWRAPTSAIPLQGELIERSLAASAGRAGAQ
jgi:hypothetical protein